MYLLNYLSLLLGGLDNSINLINKNQEEKMVHIFVQQYPHNILVIGKSTIRNSKEIEKGLQNAFQCWLDKNYLENNDINLGISLLYETKKDWTKTAKRYHVSDTYKQSMDRLELFAGKIIEILLDT